MCAALLWAACTAEDTAPPTAAAASSPVRSPRATLKQVSGTVMVKRAAGDDWLPARDGIELFENDKVRTAAGATALLDFGGSEVEVGEDALVAIAETRPRPGKDRTDLTVLKGKIDAELDDASRDSLSVSTPAATVRAGREIVFQ